MKTIYEFLEYLSDFNPISKKIIKWTIGITFLLSIVALYFILAAGRTEEYYMCMFYFEVLMENMKSILGLGCFFALLLEPIIKKYTAG